VNTKFKEDGIRCPLCDDHRPIPVGSKRGVGGLHDYNQCVACDLIYAVNIPTLKMFAQVHQGNYLERDVRKETFKLAPILSYLKLRKRMRGDDTKLSFLDIGSKGGEVTAAAKNLSCSAFGIDKDRESILEAKKNYPDSNFYAVSIEAFAKLGQKYDFINCNNVIQQAPNIKLYAKALHELSHEHTVLHLTTPNSDHLRVPKDLIDWEEIEPVLNLRLFNKNALNLLLTESGFNVKLNLPMLDTGQRLFCKINAIETEEEDDES